MESGPPLNLSTSVKVEDSVIRPSNDGVREDNLSLKGELIQQSDGNQSFVLLQPLTNNENEVLTITGEPVKDVPQLENGELDDKEEEYNDQATFQSKAKSYKCSHCSERFLRATQLRLHEKSHIEEKVHACELCLETFPRLSLLLLHKQEHTKKVYECPECDIPLNTYNGFRLHMKKHKGEKRFKCTDCPMTFVQQSHLITHRRKHTGEKPYVCEVCNNRFKQVSHLTTHLRTHTKDRPYICEFCNACFSQTGSLKRHRRSHTGEKPFQCKKCDSVFVEKRNLSRHLLSHSGIRPFKCDLCSASFTQFIDLKRHTFSHSGYKPYKCDICEASFSRKNNLKWHKLTHEGETPHKCEICNVGFRIGRDLKNHQRFHVENKPYSCDHCKASFLQLSTLKRHLNAHTGHKPYACDLCKATFFEKSSLKRHVQRHNAVKPFSCEHCLSSFLDARTLMRHKIVVHNEGKYEDSEAATALATESPSKQSGSKEISPVLEEENSLHIYEPSYQKVPPPHVPEPNAILPNTVQEISRNTPEISSQTVCQVVVNESSTENGPQVPTLVLSQPGQPPKTARPADNCQNHHSHVHTMLEGGYGQWQTWCFCETPNIPMDNNETLQISSSESHSLAMPANSQAMVPHHPNMNYQEIPQSISTTIQTLQPPLDQPQDSHNSAIQDSRIQSQSKSEAVPSNVFHNISTPHPDAVHVSEYQSTNTSYTHFNPQINSYNGEMAIVQSEQQVQQEVGESNSESLHHTDQTSQTTREIPLIMEKNNFISVTESHNIESSYRFPQPASKKICHEKDPKSKSLDCMNLMNKEQLVQRHLEDQRIVCDSFQSHEMLITDVDKNCEQKKQQNVLVSKDDVQSEGFGNTHIVPLEQEPCYRDPNMTKHQDYNYEKAHKAPEIMEQPILISKEVAENRIQVPVQSTVASSHPVVLNDLAAPKESTAIPPYQLAVYDEVPQSMPINQKEHVTLQYSQTVNNPATGDIQIQSEMFPAKAEETSLKRPIKKRRVSKNVAEKEKKLICEICSKAFSKKNQLDLHRRKHTGEKPFVCGICNQCFSHNNSLIIHMRSHTGERPFSCVYCGATFTQKSNLGVHHRVHTGEKPFKCDVCETSFSQGSHLIAHKRIHNNDRPFVCASCGQAFTQRSALKRHEMKHSGLKPHVCNTCNAKFSQKEDLKRHIVIHNGGNKGKESVTRKSVKAVYKRYGDKTAKKKTTKKAAESNAEVKKDEREDAGAGAKPSEETPQKEDREEKENVVKKSAKKTSPSKAIKSKLKDVLEPVRTSKRIKEAAEKKKFKTEDSDFITGDLEEIDHIEEIENQLIKVSRVVGWRKKEMAKANSDGVVHSWCFCEVPHGPDEPHTHSPAPKFEQEFPTDHRPQAQHEISNALMNNESCREGVLQFSLPQLSHTVVMQGEQVGLQNHSMNNGAHLSLNPENIVMNPSGIPESQVLTSSINTTEPNSLGNQFLAPADHIVTSQDVHNSHVMQDDVKTVYGTTQIISGQVLPASQFVTSEGTFYIEAGDIINNGTVVLNSSPGTFFFDLSGEGHLLNVPMSGNVAHDSVIVAGSSALNVTSNAPEPIYSTSGDPNSSNAISFSVRNAQQPNQMLDAPPVATGFSNPEIVNQNILSSVHSSMPSDTVEAGSSSTIGNSSSVQYAHIDGSEMGLFTPSLAIEPAPAPEQPPSVPIIEAPEPFKDPPAEGKLQPIVINPSKCSVCGKEFAVKSTLKQHMRSNHPGLHFCTICFDAFTTKEHLITHKMQHKSTHSCPECFLLFVNKVALNQHRQKVHKISGLPTTKKVSRSFSCTRCKASFFQLSDLNRHLLGHTGEKPFKCKQCGACFTRKSSLNKHERIHTGEKPYSCRDCDLSFAYRYQINRHRTMHKEEDQSNFSMPYVFN